MYDKTWNLNSRLRNIIKIVTVGRLKQKNKMNNWNKETMYLLTKSDSSSRDLTSILDWKETMLHWEIKDKVWYGKSIKVKIRWTTCVHKYKIWKSK